MILLGLLTDQYRLSCFLLLNPRQPQIATPQASVQVFYFPLCLTWVLLETWTSGPGFLPGFGVFLRLSLSILVLTGTKYILKLHSYDIMRVQSDH